MTALATTPGTGDSGLNRELLVLGAVVVLGTIMSILDVTIVNVAIPTLGSDFHTSISTIQWVLTGYLLAFASVIPMRVSVMVLSCGDAVQPAAEADERAGGAEDVPDAVQQPAPAAQRPGVGEMGDRLLDQRAQPSLQAVVGPLLWGEPVDGAAVPDRRVPVLAGLGHAPKPPIQQACHLHAVQHPLQSCQRQQFVLVAAARPATVAPQQVAPDGRDGKALGGVGVPLGVVQDLLVGPPTWSLHPGGQPVQADRLAGAGHLPKPLAQVVQAGDEAAVGLAVPQRGQFGQQEVQ